MTDNEMVKRLMWSGLLAGLGALASIATTKAGPPDLGPRLRGRSRPSEPANRTTTERPEARAAELREELAITDERRAEEEEAKAEQAVAGRPEGRVQEGAQAARGRGARKAAATAEAEAARERAQAAAAEAPTQAQPAASAVSGADRRRRPASGSADAQGRRRRRRRRRVRSPRPPAAPPAAVVEGPEKPELHVAAAFAGAFLFARILKKIAE